MRKVVVEWVDSNILHGWQVDGSDCDTALCEDLGYIVSDDIDKLVIARGVSGHGLLNSPMAIPTGCIKSIKELRVK